ncbi:MAG: hypothetical protein II949_09325 [Prevotella sp.]|nr:hypothetical protein [Prevotella sp.]
MAIFNWFGVKPNGNTEVTPKEEVSSEEISNPDEVSTENGKDAHENHLITITWGTGLPIDIIFNYIHKNFEEEGFQDALVNCDITYRDAKERIIRNDLEMLFKRIILRYKNDIREIDVNIKNANQAYALAAAGRLQARKETFEEHLLEINEMQSLLEKNDPKMLTMIESYRRGFQKGMAAVAINFIDNK